MKAKNEYISQHHKTSTGEYRSTTTETHTNTNFSTPKVESSPKEVPEEVLKRILQLDK